MINDPIILSMFIISDVMVFLWYIVDADDDSAFHYDDDSFTWLMGNHGRYITNATRNIDSVYIQRLGNQFYCCIDGLLISNPPSMINVRLRMGFMYGAI